MDYSVYNDYELLYLINEGSEPALNLLHRKYYHLIYVLAKAYYPTGDKIYDLIQEGRIILQECITHYRVDTKATFYSYFVINYRRRINRLLNGSYYREIDRLSDNIMDNRDYSKLIIYAPKYLFSSEEEIDMYNELIIGNKSVRQYSIEKNIPYMVVYRNYNEMLEKIRKWVK